MERGKKEEKENMKIEKMGRGKRGIWERGEKGKRREEQWKLFRRLREKKGKGKLERGHLEKKT